MADGPGAGLSTRGTAAIITLAVPPGTPATAATKNQRGDDMPEPTRDPRRPARLLLAEQSALLPILRAAAPSAFDLPTCLPGWSVRDVLAHCAAAFTMTATQSWHGFSPAENQRDVDHRRDWPIEQLLDELDDGYRVTAEAATAAGGRLDGLALGEWVHGGDVRSALDLPHAYASEGADDALVLLTERAARPDQQVPRTTVSLPDGRTLTFGTTEPPATLTTDPATLIRLCAGRDPDPAAYTLTGAEPNAYRLFD
jgi:uncharacterized protein (TIGR03083 family)